MEFIPFGIPNPVLFVESFVKTYKRHVFRKMEKKAQMCKSYAKTNLDMSAI